MCRNHGIRAWALKTLRVIQGKGEAVLVGYSGRRVLVTGSSGTVGGEIVDQLLSDKTHAPSQIICLDNRESEQFFAEQKYLTDPRVIFYLCDLRDYNALLGHFEGIDIVFHTAALKHVVMCERSPMEAVQTNILGVQNVINASLTCNVQRVVFTSSDKAVNPTNVMGTSKLMGERLMTAANANKLNKRTIFCSTRFGNVLGSSGSVVPIFKAQIRNGGPVTLTDRAMTRFVMGISEACRLVIEAADIAKGGEVFITKMPVLRIADLAQAMIEELAPQYGLKPETVSINEIGMKPGEKLYEELMSLEEVRRAVELDKYFCVKPAFEGFYSKIDYQFDQQVAKPVTNPYNSSHETALNVSEIKDLLKTLGVFESRPQRDTAPAERYWPGEKEKIS